MNTDHIPGLLRLELEELPDAVGGRNRVGVVTDAFLARLPAVEKLFASLVAAEPIVIAVGEPTSESVTTVARRLEDGEVDTVVGLGGGSAIDTAKLAALVAATATTVESHLGSIRDVEAVLDIVAVPTTAGSGAEVTRTCVVSHEGRKSWAWNDHLRPERVVVDPRLTHGLPRAGTVATGLDAFVHALEAATAPAADDEAVRSGAAAVEVIFEVLPVAVANGTDISARAEMLDAALCAGFSIDRAGTGVGHAVGHALASIVTIPHGLAVAFGMSTCLAWGMSGAPERYARVDRSGDLDRRVGALLGEIDFEREMVGWVGKPLDPKALAMELAREENQPMCRNNARPVTDEDVSTIAEMVAKAWNETLA